MDKSKWAAINGLVLGTFLLTQSVPTSFAFDKPIHTCVVLLASCAAIFIGASRFLPKEAGRTHRGQQYEAVALEDRGQQHRSREPSLTPEDVRYPSSLRKLRIFFIVLVLAICLRVGTWREIVNNVQCTSGSWAPLIPLAFAIWDFWNVQRQKSRWVSEDPESNVYEALGEFVTRAPYRYLLATGVLGLGSILALRSARAPPSTYICSSTLPYGWRVPLMQHLGTLLDIIIAFCVERLLHQQEGRGTRGMRLRFVSVGWAALFSATILFIISIMIYWASEQDREWIVTIPDHYIWGVVKFGALFCFTAVCTILSIYHTGLMTTSVIVTFVAVSTMTTSFAWNNPHPFPAIGASWSFFAFCLVVLSFAAYLHTESVSEEKSSETHAPVFNRVPAFAYLALLTLLVVRFVLWASHSSVVTYHPIDYLIYDAQIRHEAFRSQAGSSHNLEEAANLYRERYGRHPPPGFQHWYEYATARHSVIIDDYDSIHRDLLPFQALSPEEIRQRTWTMISNPWNDAAGISIRNGEVTISPNVMPTHRWMLDGIVQMIKNFAEYLPDMDLAFNLNDECRVTVPYEQIESMRKRPSTVGSLENTPKNSFSTTRAEQWKAIPEEGNEETPLVAISFHPSFYAFGSVGCPPTSPARTQRIWDVSTLCTACAAPHSLGAFLANWTLAADICHQPDLANLHGLYISPAAYKGTRELYPIFSQSKAHTFNDILYPSAWNYMDKAHYDPDDDGGEHTDPPFGEKQNTLFWRGATSEGVSPGGGQWRGMARQRFIHHANSIYNSSTRLLPPSTLLLPVPSDYTNRSLHYTQHPPASAFPNTDVHIVDSIARCGGRDCIDQSNEFSPLFPPADFQSHWRYRYLLDLDGAGFSGRFLPFLQSRSLPFKAALFREWWDDRLTPWWHYVPLDLRGQGFWATLEYFAGDAEGQGARVNEGARMGDKGREWAGLALRKEDMEIYFFRLLLEWGRLTDDARDELGYDGGWVGG